ncbi:Enc1 [Symbiodinium natans]|uniref:Enc1 protein n=1 Tax=Symbiodinium natans TaxID=878477 RepID=A0A812RET5_9DINO|nr:Enc1 [Symbiodinium natans]
MPTRRAGSAAALLDDGRMMIIGGYDERGIAEGLLASCDIFDPVAGAWIEDGAAPLPRSRWGHGCASLQGKVYVVGGCSLQLDAPSQESFMETLRQCDIYLPKENRWIPTAPLQIARSGTRVVALGSRVLTAIGGCDDVFGRAETQPTVELYDVENQHWSVLQHRLTHPRTTAGAAAIDGKALLVVGGAPSYSTVEVYRVQTAADAGFAAREGEKVADLSDGRMGCQAAVLALPSPEKTYPVVERRCVVVVGGERCDEDVPEYQRIKQLAGVPVYDTQLGQWRKDDIVPPLPCPRTAVAVCVGLARPLMRSTQTTSCVPLPGTHKSTL